MKLVVHIGEHRFAVNPGEGVSLAVPLDFDSARADFGVATPTRQPIKAGDFVGDTKQGGSCNVDSLTFVPHCHGTHTETMGHIVDDVVTIAANAPPEWIICALLTVDVKAADETTEASKPPALAGDGLITADGLDEATRNLFQSIPPPHLEAYDQHLEKALVVRCRSVVGNRPVHPAEAFEMPPYFTNEAIRWCNQREVCHLLVESPSIDRMEDGGLLTNHHLYWNVPEGTHRAAKDSWPNKTITESICIDQSLNDGIYLLNLQVPALGTDASPSRPVLHALHLIDDSESRS